MKKTLALLLALVMALSLLACAAKTAEPAKTETETKPAETKTEEKTEQKTEPEETGMVVHPGQMPLVDEPVTLRIAALCSDYMTDPESSWLYKFFEEKLGVNIELEYFYPGTRDESVALMMADSELPDLMLGIGFTPEEISRYGTGNGLFLDMNPYINETNAPNLNQLYNVEKPEQKAAMCDATGALYTLGYYSAPMQFDYSGYRMFYNWDLMEQAGIEKLPETLDEFMDMLRAEKQYGEDNGIDIVPFGGNYARYNPTYLIMNALGYNRSMGGGRNGPEETSIMLRNGQVVMPAYDREAFPKYLETMHTMYEEGLMEQDFYTLDKDTTKAHLTSGMYGVFQEVPGMYGGGEFGQQWWGGIPLTSEYNDTAFWPNDKSVSVGGFAISADTEYPELCVAIADFFCTPDYGQLMLRGPSVNQEDIQLGFDGWYYDAELQENRYADFVAHESDWESINHYMEAKYCFFSRYTFCFVFGEYNEKGENSEWFPDLTGLDTDSLTDVANYRFTTDNFNDQWTTAMAYTWCKYKTDEITPNVCFFDEDTTTRLSDLKTLIDDYAVQEIAKFVTGARDLSEIDGYFNELQKLGADEYVGYYADYYAAQQAAAN